jgi:putative heme-binding domain-containing protein
VDGTQPGFGPELTALPREATDEFLVESILEPSKVIRKGFELASLSLVDGRIITGLVTQSDDQRIVLRDASAPDKTIVISRGDIESQKTNNLSAMPAGVASQITSRQSFLDLVRYLIEIRDGGRSRAAALAPPSSLVTLQLPEYESHVDHAGLIDSLDAAASKRGKAIYERLCINCHGTREQPGSLPTSLRFAEGKFKNGNDPFAMYQTLTRGFGLMAPQSWMVPQQKYDVIHYIRQEYLRKHNPSQLFSITRDYLAGLPRGDTRGPEPRLVEPWRDMDYGPSLIGTFEIGADASNIAQKGIAIRLDPGPGGVARGRAFMVFEHDTLRWAAGWTGSGFIDWNGINFNGKHQVHPRVVGDVVFSNPTGPGWAEPGTSSLADEQRVIGRDDRRYGPLPRSWGRYRGLYHTADRVVVAYTVGNTEVLESPGLIEAGQSKPATFTRTIEIGPRDREMVLVVCERNATPEQIPAEHGCSWATIGDRLCLRIAASSKPLRFILSVAHDVAGKTLTASLNSHPSPLRKELATTSRWPQKLTTKAIRGSESGPFAVDILTHPEQNPWQAQLRLTGIDFLPGGDAAVICTWDGDVWRVTGLSNLDNVEANAELTWQRIASGLFQPLGIKCLGDDVYVTCRDQLVKLRDFNGDGETDFYECINSDHQVTEHFHEFAMGLQTDSAGNFYYAKSARHALPAVVPQHGTLLRISSDGSHTDILATGFRAANGVCLNDDGTFVVTDQEGHWNPKNRINWVVPGKFYGNMFGYHDVTNSSDSAMEQPLCWITNQFDRSPGELLWVPPNHWGPLTGSLINLSYGAGKLFVVPFQEVNGQKQGGMCMLPVGPLPTGVMRGRFHPTDKQLYCCGMFAWAGNAIQPGGLYRIRYTGRPMYLPIALRAKIKAIEIDFTDPIDRQAGADPENYAIKTWSLKRTANYGSEHYDEHPLTIERAEISADGRSVTLGVPELSLTWGMEIACRLTTPDGERIERVIHNSIHRLSTP